VLSRVSCLFRLLYLAAMSETAGLLRTVNGDHEEKRSYLLPSRLVVEFFGTLAFVFFGAGCASHINVELVAVSAAHGVITMVLIFLFAHVSGAYFNAGPTVADMVFRRLRFVDGLLYLVFQASGGIVGGVMLLLIYGKHSALGTPALAPGVTVLNGFFIEFFGTMMLSIVANLSTSGHHTRAAPLAIGATLFCIFLIGAPLDGAAMNPWRWLGPAVASRNFAHYLWIYFVGPISGFLTGHLLTFIFATFSV